MTDDDDPKVSDEDQDAGSAAAPAGVSDDADSDGDGDDGDAGSADGPPPVDDEVGRQKRENVRVDVQLPLIVRMHGREIPARTRDVSATGIGFSTRLPVELEQHADVSIDFEDWTFDKRVTIRFIKPLLAGSMVGAQFDELTEDERERLVKQVFDVQRAQLRAGRS